MRDNLEENMLKTCCIHVNFMVNTKSFNRFTIFLLKANIKHPRVSQAYILFLLQDLKKGN